eukprot:Pompholyxophrys_punicea_v1_NODE_237_length_2605_cov_11.778910.p1 type:complete len:409 gc:universal NODE_237_length_2605_cov_11.778910:1541-315(-)
MLRHGMEASQSGLVTFGIKGACILSILSYFNIPLQCILDYMHMICLGVGGKMLDLWFNATKHKDCPFYIGRKVLVVDERIARLRPPSFVTTSPRSIQDHLGHWKANEYYYFIVYYSVVVLDGILEEKYFVHWLLFVEALHILLSKSITPEALEYASTLLNNFYQQFGDLYGETNITMNVHLLKHLCLCVYFNGPLWVYSCWVFENVNGVMRRTIHGTFLIENSIIDRCLYTLQLKKKMKNCHNIFLQKFLDDSFTKKSLPPRRYSFKINDLIFCLGATAWIKKPSWCTFKEDDILQTNRIWISGVVWTSMEYIRSKKHLNYFVSFWSSDGTKKIGAIKDFYIVSDQIFAAVQCPTPCPWKWKRSHLKIAAWLPLCSKDVVEVILVKNFIDPIFFITGNTICFSIHKMK